MAFVETVVLLNIKQQYGGCVFNLPFDGGGDESRVVNVKSVEIINIGLSANRA